MEEVSFEIIASCGDANAEIHLALISARNNIFNKTEKHLMLADEAINKAHVAHTSVLHSEASGIKSEYSVLFSHAQDTMMNVMTMRDMAEEFVELYKKIN